MYPARRFGSHRHLSRCLLSAVIAGDKSRLTGEVIEPLERQREAKSQIIC
jgi:hypothetical protein